MAGDTNLRIEALRAAAHTTGGIWAGLAQAAVGTGNPSAHITDQKVQMSTLATAEIFLQWLKNKPVTSTDEKGEGQ